MKALVLCAALACAPAIADDYVMRGRNGDSIRLTAAACAPDILKLIPAEVHELVQAADAVIAGKQYRACWLFRPDIAGIALQYEDGDAGMIPVSEFRPEPGV